MRKDVSFFNGSEVDAERRRRLAQTLMEQSKPSPTQVIGGMAIPQSPMEGLAKAVSAGMAGYQEGKLAREEKQKAENARKVMADAISNYNRSQAGGETQFSNGETVSWNKQDPITAGQRYAQTLMGNEDTAQFGMEAMMGQMESQQRMANELAMMREKMPFELELAREKARIENQYRPAQASPAAVQIANEIQKARQAGDTQRVNDLLLSAKMLDKGVIMDPGGNPVEMSGYGGVVGDIAYDKQAGKKQADLDVANNAALPQQEASAEMLVSKLDELIAHPGLGYAVGKTSILPIVPGTRPADFKTRLDQIQGDTFLQAYNDLRGGGQITEIEGKKAEAAKARMSRAQTEQEFVEAAQEYQDIIEQGIARKRESVERSRFSTTNPALTQPYQNIAPAMEASQMGGGDELSPEEQAELKALRERFGR